MLKSGVVPNEYLMMTYNFLMGCYWIKFTPLFPIISNCISALINAADEEMRNKIV